jgi:hypothetical protein
MRIVGNGLLYFIIGKLVPILKPHPLVDTWLVRHPVTEVFRQFDLSPVVHIEEALWRIVPVRLPRVGVNVGGNGRVPHVRQSVRGPKMVGEARRTLSLYRLA